MKKRVNLLKPFKQNKKIIVPFIYFVISVVLFSVLFFGNLLPFKYLFLAFLGLIFINYLAFSASLKAKRKGKKIILHILAGFFLILFVVGTFYFNTLVNMFRMMTDTEYIEETYHVIVRKSDSDNLEKYSDDTIGIVRGDLMVSMDFIEEYNLQFKDQYEENLWILAQELQDENLDVLLLKDDFYHELEEDFEGFDDEFKTIYTNTIKVRQNFSSKSVNITKESFVVLLSGIDTTGSINAISRSDANILMVVNPKTAEILQIHIPRDYYVEFHGLGYKDKLTHSGAISPEMTVRTVEDLFEIEINYYAKVNMTGFVQIIDVIGGIEVDNPTYFCHGTGKSALCFPEGRNNLSGESALRYVRERKSLYGGDRDRGKNQQRVIEATLRKMMQPTSLARIPSMLNVVGGSVKTNISNNELDKFFKFQLSNMPNWTIQSMSVDGPSDVIDTPIYPFPMDIMHPNMSTVNKARDAIMAMMK